MKVQICYRDCTKWDEWEMNALPRQGDELEYVASGENMTVERVAFFDNGEIWLITDKVT